MPFPIFLLQLYQNDDRISPLAAKCSLVISLTFFLTGCFSHRPIHTLEPIPVCNEAVCRGVASWYGKDFHGRKTSSGEVYNMYGLSAAHRTLPLGTLLKVTSVENQKSVVVKVNDRGPFIAGRVLDLSYGAASELGMVQKGTSEVIYSVVQIPADAGRPFFTIQVGAFSVKENASRFQLRMNRQYPESVRVTVFESPYGPVYRVRVGLFPKEDEAEKEAGRLQKENGIIPFVVKEDHFQ